MKSPAFVYRTAITLAKNSLLDFMPFTAMAFASERSLDQNRAFALAGYYERNKRWADMERELRRDLALNDAFYARRGKGNGYVHALLAKALIRQGKKAEARREASLAHARAEGNDGGGVEHTLREAGL